MAKWNAARGSTGRIAWVFLPDSSSTVGAGKTALTNASVGLNITLRREKAAAVVTYTGGNIGTIVTLGTWVDPGAGKANFKEVDATNLPGIYEVHFVDLQFVVGDNSRWLGGMVQATGIAPSPFELELDGADLQNATSLGLTNVDTTISSRSILAAGAAMTLTAGERVSTADALLTRDMSAVTGEASRSPLNAFRFLRNLWQIVSGILTVMKEDDVTPAWTGNVTTAAGNPVTKIDPS